MVRRDVCVLRAEEVRSLFSCRVAARGWGVANNGSDRMDVFSTGDLGVQRGVAAYLGRDVAKLKNKGGKWKYCSEQDMLETAAKFAPYR